MAKFIANGSIKIKVNGELNEEPKTDINCYICHKLLGHIYDMPNGMKYQKYLESDDLVVPIGGKHCHLQCASDRGLKVFF